MVATVKDLFKAGDAFRDEIFNVLLCEYLDIDVKAAKELVEGDYPEGTKTSDIVPALREKARANFDKGYDDILKLDPAPNADNTICLAYRYLYPLSAAKTYDVCCIDPKDFLENYKYTSYASCYEDLMHVTRYTTSCFMFDDRENILGYWMCPISIRRYPLPEVIAALYWEITWFGYTNEEAAKNMQEKMDELDDDMTEYKSITDDDLENWEIYDDPKEALFDEHDHVMLGCDEEFDDVYEKDSKNKAVLNYNEESEYMSNVLFWLKGEQAKKEDKGNG